MTSLSVFQSLLVFALCAIGSGILSAVKSIIGFFQRQNSGSSITDEPLLTQNLVKDATTLWTKPGFFESISLGRFLFDGGTVLSGIHTLERLFPQTGIIKLGLYTLIPTYLISHWIFPVLAQAFSPYLGIWAVRIYKLYSFLFMGKLGEMLFQTHDFAMRRLGTDPKLNFLGEMHLQKLSPSADEDNPDRSGLEDDEKEMIRSIFDLRETQVKEIMTPRVDIISLPADAIFPQVMEVVHREKYSRIPVYQDNIDHIIGILHTMDLMGLDENSRGPNFNLTNLVREVYFVPRTKKIGGLMREFRKKHIHMAMVVDEYGGTAGLITLEDILEEIVGEIHDEDETEKLKIQKVGDGSYIVDPIISLSDLNQEMNANFKPQDPDIQIDTLGGLILFVHGKMPELGDRIPFKEFYFEILEMDGQKMEKIRLSRHSDG